MQRKLSLASLELVMWLAVLARPVSAGQPTIEEIIAGLEEVEKQFFESDSFFIRYERTKSLNLLSGKSNQWNLAEWTSGHSGKNWLNKRRFTKPSKNAVEMVPAEPKTQLGKGQFALEWNQNSNFAVVGQTGKDGNLYVGWIYTHNLSLNAPKYICKSTGDDFNVLRQEPAFRDELNLPCLPDFLRANKEHYTVSTTQEKVDGIACWVLEWPGMDRIWIDPARGYAVPRRIYSWAPGKPARKENHLLDYREVKNGFWLPFKQIVEGYASLTSDPPDLWGKKTYRLEYTVHALEFDSLSEDFFEIKLPPGTRVLDSIRNMRYTVTDNQEPFISAIAEVRRRQQRSLLIWLIVGGAILSVGGYIVYRLRSRAKAA